MIEARLFRSRWNDFLSFTVRRLPPWPFRLALLLLTVFWAGRAQAVPDGAADDYVMQVWDTDSGLPNSTVNSIAQTPDGYLWLGTLHGGLARFDGIRFVNFHPGNTPELKSIEIHKLFVDAQGTLWINNVQGGVISYRSGKFSFEFLDSEILGSLMEDILCDQPGRLEFATRAGKIFRRVTDPATDHWDTIPSPTSAQITSMSQDADGVTWWRTLDGKLFQMTGSQAVCLTNPPGLHKSHINALAKDYQGRIWVATPGEMAVWNGKNFVDMTPTNGEPTAAVDQLFPCPDGSFWVQANDRLRKCSARRWQAEADLWNGVNPDRATRSKFFADLSSLFVDSPGGIWLAHGQNGIGHVRPDGRVSWVHDSQHLLHGTVNCWFEDHEGNIWTGLADGGLARLRPRIFHGVWPADGTDTKLASSVCEDESGAMWFGTGGAQVWRWDEAAFSLFNPPAPDSAKETTVLPAANGGLWIGSVRNGLLELTNGVFQRPFPGKAVGTVVRCLYRDRRGAVWMGSEFGMFRWDQNGLKVFSARDGYSPAYVLAFTEDQAGDVWFGTALGELRHIHNGKFETFVPEDSLTDEATLKAAAEADPYGHNRGALSGGERFWSLHFDRENVLWIGTLGGGLLRFAGDHFTRFTTRDGLPSDYISQILEDNFGRLWLGTGAGIVRVARSELNAATATGGGKSKPGFVAYGKFDGLPALECSGGTQPNCWRSQDGRLWFTTVKGAVWIDPAALRLNLVPPQVHLEEFLLDGATQVEKGFVASQPASQPPTKMKIAAGRHYFEFKFCAASLTSPGQVEYKWRLAGLEKDWVVGGGRRNADYSFIPPGEYRFEVMARNNDGIWSAAPAVMELTVLPYFWQRWWFRLAVGLCIACGLMTVYSIRVNRLRMLERLRLQIARDLHDEVGANLGSISLLAQIMEKSPSSTDASQVRAIAMQTIDTLRDIIWFIDPKHDNLPDLVMRLSETSRVMLSATTYTFEQRGDIRPVGLSLAFRRNVPALFKEALHNLLKHSGATRVAITVGQNENIFQFRVEDNGVGFRPGAATPGSGLKNMKRRAAEIGGQLAIESSPGGGTVVALSAPLT